MKSYKSDKIWEDWRDFEGGRLGTACPAYDKEKGYCNNEIIRQAFGDDWACSFVQCKYYNGYKAAKEKEYVEGYKKWSLNNAVEKLICELRSGQYQEPATLITTEEYNKLKDENQKYKNFIIDLRLFLYYYHILNLIKGHEIKL